MEPRDRAARLADELLFPATLTVDRTATIPRPHFDSLAAEGLYNFNGDLRVVEELAGGCLATAFVWAQHHGTVATAASSEQPGIRETWLEPLSRGDIRGGIARAGARPGTSSLTARSTVDGFRLDGRVPWVTGWGLVDVLEVAAVDGDDVRFFFIDATESGTLRAELNHLVAVQASNTVNLTFTGHHVPADRFVNSRPLAGWVEAEAPGSAFNGGLALGVASRCCKLMDGGTSLLSELDACRDALLSAGPASIPDARAAASELAMRAATTLAVHTGSRSVLLDNHAQRLLREAAFLLVFGTRPLIKKALLTRLARRAYC
jgi:alkylation response protein AidB-like acyl-CoA dehydrogenase